MVIAVRLTIVGAFAVYPRLQYDLGRDEMATPNSPFMPPDGAGDQSTGTRSSARPLPPPPPGVPSSALDATLGALVAEGSTGLTSPPERRRGSLGTVLVGGALIVAAGLGLGWAIGRATGETAADSAASFVPTVDKGSAGSSVGDGSVSDAPPSGSETSDGSQPGVGQPSTEEGDAAVPGSVDSPATPTTAGISNTAVSSIATTVVPAPVVVAPVVVPSPPDPAASVAVGPDEATTAAPPAVIITDPVAVPPPTVVAQPIPGDDTQLPTAFAVLEAGRLTIRGTFVDQAGLDEAVAKLTPLGTDGVSVEASVDPQATGSRAVPVLVSDAALFQAGSAVMEDAAQPVLDLFAVAMAVTATSRLIIEGHTDSQGSDAYNFALSQQRIAAVFAYLTSKGIDPGRLELAPKGETEPVADNATVEGRARNRRVELIFAA